MHQNQLNNDPYALQIKSKLTTFRQQAKTSFPKSQQSATNPATWFIENVIKNKINVPRITLLKESLQFITTESSNNKIITQVFVEENSLNHILIECENMVDMAFVLYQHLVLKGKVKKVEYSAVVMETIDSKLSFFCQKQKKKMPTLLRINYVDSFISFKQVTPKQIFDKLTQFQIKELKQEVFLLFEYLIKPWIEKYRPSKYYEELSQIIYWNVILDDDSVEKEQMLISFVDIVEEFFCPRKRSDSAFVYFKLFSKLMDILAINYRREDPFKIYCLAPILNQWQDTIKIEQIMNWLQEKGKDLKPQQIENIFRNTYHIGSTIFMFNLIELFSKALKEKQEFNILYHLFLSYIKKEYLDIVLPNPTFVETYFRILELYAIGFINHDRLEGESQLDKLTHNLATLLLNKKFNFKKHYETIIMFYKVYEARFSYLSSVSRKFVSDLQRLSKYDPELLDIHNKIHRGAFREAGFGDDQNSGFEQLNIKRTDRYRGFMNLGNTCYMNSFMQAMFMTKKFRSAILDIRDQQHIPNSKALFYALSNLFTQLSTKTIGVDTQIIPELFKMETPEPFKQSWEQHDVAEFGRIYIQSLVNQFDDEKTKERIEKIFSNKIRKSIICYTCKNQKENIEQVFDFILHLNKKDDSISVSKLLGEYFQGEKMEGENQVQCDRCRKKTNALARPHPIRLAEYLLVTIGLFEYSGGGKKIKKPFNFEFTINFNKILPTENAPDENYELYAFIVHIGNQVERGHYICYARNLQQNPTIWYCFDDAFVTEREIQTVEDFKFGESETPYLLFYSASRKRKSIQGNFGSQLFTK